jgi:hypothetical protein
MIDQIPSDAFELLFATVTESLGAKSFIPRLAAFERAWRKLKPRFVQQKLDTGPKVPCDLCDSSGMMWFTGRPREFDGSIDICIDPENGVLYHFTIPCVCANGQVYPCRDHGLQAQVRLFREDYIHRAMSNRNYTYEGKGTADWWFAWDMVRESYRIARRLARQAKAAAEAPIAPDVAAVVASVEPEPVPFQETTSEEVPF